MKRVAVATFNIGSSNEANAYSDLSKLALRADVICFQEASDRNSLIKRWAEDHGWRVYFGDGTSGAAATPIAWRRGLMVTGKFTTEAVPATNVGDPGAGPAMVKRKVINRIRIGFGPNRWHIINDHLIASATVRNNPNVTKRRRHYHTHIRALENVMTRRRGCVVSVGDFNAEDDFDLLAPIRKIAHQVVKVATHGNRTIDLVWINRKVGCSKVEALELHSDHRAVVAYLYKR